MLEISKRNFVLLTAKVEKIYNILYRFINVIALNVS